jgi:hypothetical protein
MTAPYRYGKFFTSALEKHLKVTSEFSKSYTDKKQDRKIVPAAGATAGLRIPALCLVIHLAVTSYRS